MRKMIILRILLVLMIIGTNIQSIYLQKMPDDANKLYQDFSKAINELDADALELTLCKSSLTKMKNEAISTGMSYPKDVLEGMKMGLPDYKNFKYLSFKKYGETINAYYLFGENKSESVLLTICMLEEDGKLKIIELKMRDAKDFIINLNKKDYSFLDANEFLPSGMVPEIPALIEKVDYIANIDITSYGYTVSVTVNGIYQETVKNKSMSGVLLGGINKGENTIEILIEKTDPLETFLPEVGIRALIAGEEVQAFYIKEELVGTLIKKSFIVK